MRALALYAGPAALRHIQHHGLQPQHVRALPAAAGGPKGLMLLRLDRFLFGDWLPQSDQPIDLIGASIGAWRWASACMPDPVAALQELERIYVRGDFGQRQEAGTRHVPAPAEVSAAFARFLQQMFAGHEQAIVQNPRYRLHVLASQGRGLLQRENGRWQTLAGYLAAYAGNAVQRQALGRWLQRLVFSSGGAALPFDDDRFPTQQIALEAGNLLTVLQASGSIPFVLQAVHDIPGAPPGACWDGGITDYHLHLRYRGGQGGESGIVLYPHFQRAVIPGWLDKAWRWRHGSSAALDHVLLLGLRPEWVASLPRGKLPDRSDFRFHLADPAARMRDWNQAIAASEQLVDEFAAWLERPDPGQVLPP